MDSIITAKLNLDGTIGPALGEELVSSLSESVIIPVGNAVRVYSKESFDEFYDSLRNNMPEDDFLNTSRLIMSTIRYSNNIADFSDAIRQNYYRFHNIDEGFRQEINIRIRNSEDHDYYAIEFIDGENNE